jgi:hypothetical protein
MLWRYRIFHFTLSVALGRITQRKTFISLIQKPQMNNLGCEATNPSLYDSIMEGSFFRSSTNVENPTRRSAAAQNAGTDPVTTTASTRSSASKYWYAVINSSIISAVTALN